jgi:hypothetical protein
MKKGSFAYLEQKLHVWTIQDAKNILGDSLAYREGVAGPDKVDIFAFTDPTKQMRQFELGFSRGDLSLQHIYAYPWNLTLDECKKLWGDNYKTIKNPDGTKFYSYKDRHLNVLVNGHGDVLSLGIF